MPGGEGLRALGAQELQRAMANQPGSSSKSTETPGRNGDGVKLCREMPWGKSCPSPVQLL